MQRFFALFCLGTIALTAGCITTSRDSTPSINPVSSPAADNIFDPAQVEPGDRVLGLEVTRVNVSRMEPQDQWVGTVNFEGEVTVSGIYSAYTPADLNESFPCFNVDENSAEQLPRFPEDQRRTWFCFDNPEGVLQALGEPSNQSVSIVIDRFEYAYIPSDVTNRATFVRVAE
jgi:hypothetical protein